jgi:IS5 family transposase
MSIKEHAVEVHGEYHVPQGQRARAVQVVAATAANADECREVLAMLGLDPREALDIPRPREQS